MSIGRSMRTAAALLGLGAALPWIAMAKGPANRPPQSLSAEQLEIFCEEEQRFTEPWIRWAGENRSICLMQTTSPAEQADCLATVRAQLDAHHSEHQAILLQEMQTLQPGHPLMQVILGRLRERERFATMALEADMEPARLVTVRKESCLNQR